MNYVASGQIKVPQERREGYVAPIASFKKALKGPSFPP
jgi:hypothetical protein